MNGFPHRAEGQNKSAHSAALFRTAKQPPKTGGFLVPLNMWTKLAKCAKIMCINDTNK